MAENEIQDRNAGSLEPSEKRKLLQAASAAAAKGDIEGMAASLYGSFFLDGLVGQLDGQWSELDREDLEDAVAVAAADAFAKAQRGEAIRSLPGFIRVAAVRNAEDRHRSRLREHPVDEADLTELMDDRRSVSGQADEDSAPTHPAENLHPDEKRRLAVRLARDLAQQIKTDSERNVVILLLDAIENETASDLEAADIAKALGLRVDHVRKAKERGLEKLMRLAQAAGYWDDSLDIAGLLRTGDDHE